MSNLSEWLDNISDKVGEPVCFDFASLLVLSWCFEILGLKGLKSIDQRLKNLEDWKKNIYKSVFRSSIWSLQTIRKSSEHVHQEKETIWFGVVLVIEGIRF